MNFTSGGTIGGTLSAPLRPPGIPETYAFDPSTELWMPPEAIKPPAAAPVSSGIQVTKGTLLPHEGNLGDPSTLGSHVVAPTALCFR